MCETVTHMLGREVLKTGPDSLFFFFSQPLQSSFLFPWIVYPMQYSQHLVICHYCSSFSQWNGSRSAGWHAQARGHAMTATSIEGLPATLQFRRWIDGRSKRIKKTMLHAFLDASERLHGISRVSKTSTNTLPEHLFQDHLAHSYKFDKSLGQHYFAPCPGACLGMLLRRPFSALLRAPAPIGPNS